MGEVRKSRLQHESFLNLHTTLAFFKTSSQHIVNFDEMTSLFGVENDPTGSVKVKGDKMQQ